MNKMAYELGRKLAERHMKEEPSHMGRMLRNIALPAAIGAGAGGAYGYADPYPDMMFDPFGFISEKLKRRSALEHGIQGALIGAAPGTINELMRTALGK